MDDWIQLTSVGFLLFPIKKQLECGITTNLQGHSVSISGSYFCTTFQVESSIYSLKDILMLAHLSISANLFSLSAVNVCHHYV